MSVTYHEMRMWARWLVAFTPQAMADALGTPIEVGEQACVALEANGVIKRAGTIFEYGEEVVLFEYDWPPPGPKEHPHQTPPEITAVRMFGYLLYDERGVSQRLVNDRNRRNLLSIPGQGHKHRQREKRYKKMMEKAEQRRTKQKLKALGFSGDGPGPEDHGQLEDGGNKDNGNV